MTEVAMVQGESTLPANVVDFAEVRQRRTLRSAATASPMEGNYASHAPSSTSAPEPATPSGELLAAVETELRRLLASPADEAYEDGMENDLSRGVESLVGTYGSAVVEVLGRLHTAGEIPPPILSEALLWLGRVDDERSREQRLWFLIYCLREADPSVKSAAALGLASLEDPRAVPYLRREIQATEIGLLRSRLEVLAAELQEIA